MGRVVAVFGGRDGNGELGRATVGGTASPETGQISFTGKVLDGQGKPVPDANVVFYEVRYGDSAAIPTAKPVKSVSPVRTERSSSRLAKEWEGYRQGSIIARKEGLALGWAAWEMSEGDQQSDIPTRRAQGTQRRRGR